MWAPCATLARQRWLRTKKDEKAKSKDRSRDNKNNVQRLRHVTFFCFFLKLCFSVTHKNVSTDAKWCHDTLRLPLLASDLKDKLLNVQGGGRVRLKEGRKVGG